LLDVRFCGEAGGEELLAGGGDLGLGEPGVVDACRSGWRLGWG
jgi:hypothetical protein